MGVAHFKHKSPLQFTALTPSGQLNLPLPRVYLFTPSGRLLEGEWTLESENLEILTSLLTGRLEAHWELECLTHWEPKFCCLRLCKDLIGTVPLADKFVHAGFPHW